MFSRATMESDKCIRVRERELEEAEEEEEETLLPLFCTEEEGLRFSRLASRLVLSLSLYTAYGRVRAARYLHLETEYDGWDARASEHTLRVAF